MSLLPSIISKSSQPFVLLQSTTSQSCLPILRSIVDKALVRRTVVLVSLLYPSTTILAQGPQSLSNLRLIDLTAQIPGYSDTHIDPSEEILKAISSGEQCKCYEMIPVYVDRLYVGRDGDSVDVVIDSVDTLLSNLGSSARTYQVLNNILNAIKRSSCMSGLYSMLYVADNSTAASRLIVHVLAPCPLIPLLTEVRLSSSLVYLKAHPPVLLTHVASAYLMPPPPQSTPEKFWSVFIPLSERYHESEQLVYGANREGSGGGEVVVEILVRGSGGGRRRGVERVLEGWISSTATPCGLQDLESLKTVWAKKGTVQEVCIHSSSVHSDSNFTVQDAPDPTKNISFNLNLTAEQQHARSQVPLPYAHEGMPIFFREIECMLTTRCNQEKPPPQLHLQLSSTILTPPTTLMMMIQMKT